MVVFEMASGPDHNAAGSETRTLHCGGQKYTSFLAGPTRVAARCITSDMLRTLRHRHRVTFFVFLL